MGYRRYQTGQMFIEQWEWYASSELPEALRKLAAQIEGYGNDIDILDISYLESGDGKTLRMIARNYK